MSDYNPTMQGYRNPNKWFLVQRLSMDLFPRSKCKIFGYGTYIHCDNNVYCTTCPIVRNEQRLEYSCILVKQKPSHSIDNDNGSSLSNL